MRGISACEVIAQHANGRSHYTKKAQHGCFMIVVKISFDEISQYWNEVNHFGPNKIITETVQCLGPYISPFDDPRRFSYGLIDNNTLIGVTHLVEWDHTHVRYRTVNIRSEYRGRGLGWYLIKEAWNTDWKYYTSLFGYVKRSHYEWAVNHNFSEIDGNWVDEHIAMERAMNDIME